jgi:hypothetical protein
MRFMAGKLRLEYLGAIYAGMNRGDGCEHRFRTDAERTPFLITPGQAGYKTGWQRRARGGGGRRR